MAENIKVRWLTDHEQTKIAPKTLATQILNEDGTHFTDTVEAINIKLENHTTNNDIHVTAEEKETWSHIVDGYATEEYVNNLYKKLSSNTVLGFYCVEDVTIITNGIAQLYPANSNVEVTFTSDDTFEIITTSDNSILSLTAFPAALGTFYPWLEGVAQFSNILFDMNDEAMYSKWSQGNQGSYHVQKAQYINCIFWSDNPYISDVARRTNYTLTNTSQLPLCYSTIPDNTFKTFYLAFGVNSDPNWGNQVYKDSFAKANWATQVFSYYGAQTIGIVGHDDPDFNIVLPKDCRGLMFDARHVENAGTFDAVNTTNFGAKSGSWREAFGFCISLRRLYIKNLKVSLNISWSPVDYDSISYIISAASNTSKITISVSPYTYNLLSDSDFELAASKNITIALLTSNYTEDKRLGEIANKADRSDIVNADWNQNDATTFSYVKNRTHWIDNDGETYHPLDERFIPDTIARQEYIDLMFALKSEIPEKEDLSGYETIENSQAKLETAKTYADSVSAQVKNDLLNGAGAAYDTLKELGDLINENHDAIDALEIVATNKADKIHNHDDLYYTEAEIDSAFEAVQESINAAIDNAANKDIAILAEAQNYSDTNLENARIYTDAAKAEAIAEGANSAVNTINTKLATDYYDKEAIDNLVLITSADIDAIWGVSAPSIITFRVSDSGIDLTCQAEEDMTWEDFVNSSYNIDQRFTLRQDYGTVKVALDGLLIIEPEAANVPVLAQHTIIADYVYTTETDLL